MRNETDRIVIKSLEVFAKHGVLQEENVLGQKFIISAALYTGLRAAGKTDNLSLSVDYSKICRDIKGFVEGNTFKLIETVAERLAEKLLLENRAVRKIRLEVSKPWAPVGAHVESLSVDIERAWHTVYIALGSNIGDRKAYLDFAAGELKKAELIRDVTVSAYMVTKPYGNVTQDDFLNGCAFCETLLEPYELLGFLQDVEKRAGRERSEHWGPRTLDLDIIFYDDLIMSEHTLTIPHADMHNREFVLQPMCEIAPFMVHPVLGKTVKALLSDLMGA